MIERKFKKLVREHPYLLDDTFTISRSEAKKIYKEGFPSAEELLEGAKRKYADLPPEGWKRFDDALAEQKAKKQKRRVCRLDLDKVFCIVNRHRRLVIACLILTLALSFFTLVPAGRALASNIVKFIVNVFENRIEISPNDTSGFIDITEKSQDIHISVGKHDELPTDIAVETFVLPVDWLNILSIDYEAEPHMKLLLTVYSDISGDTINVSQVWDVSHDENQYIQNQNYSFKPVFEDETIFYALDEIDGSYDGVIILDNYILRIQSYSKELFFRVIDSLE